MLHTLQQPRTAPFTAMIELSLSNYVTKIRIITLSSMFSLIPDPILLHDQHSVILPPRPKIRDFGDGTGFMQNW